MKKSIYLDSNDFSDLSKPEEELRGDDKAVLHALRNSIEHGAARVLLSPPLLSEAVHATETSKEYALRRAKLMRELCEKNFLPYPTDILRKEFALVTSNSPSKLALDDFISSEGEWFGTPYTLQSLKETRQKARQKLDERLKHLPRAERRKLKSQLDPLKASSRPLLRRLIKEGQQSNSGPAEYPLSLLDQNLYLDWLLGDTTDAAMQKHMHDILCDPYFLFDYIVDETGHRDQLYNLVRNGGTNLSDSLERFGQQIIRLGELSIQMGRQLKARDLTDELVSSSFIRTMVASIPEAEIDQLGDPELLATTDQCPSASTTVHVLREYVNVLVQSNLTRAQRGDASATKPKRSDFGDLMHVFYAPYVDIFRCDARFGEHLRKNNSTQGRIASQRKDILHML